MGEGSEQGLLRHVDCSTSSSFRFVRYVPFVLLNRSQFTMALLPFTVTDPSGSRPHQPLILVQSSASQTCLPVLRNLIQPAKRPGQTLLFCFLYPPTSLIADQPNVSNGSLTVFDYTARIPGYDETRDSCNEILVAVRSGQETLQVEGRQAMLIINSSHRITPCNHRLCRHPRCRSRIKLSDVQVYQVPS